MENSMPGYKSLETLSAIDFKKTCDIYTLSPFTAEKMGNLRHSPVLARVRWWVHESGDSFPVPLFSFPPRMTHFSEYPTGDSSLSACKSKAV